MQYFLLTFDVQVDDGRHRVLGHVIKNLNYYRISKYTWIIFENSSENKLSNLFSTYVDLGDDILISKIDISNIYSTDAGLVSWINDNAKKRPQKKDKSIFNMIFAG